MAKQIEFHEEDERRLLQFFSSLADRTRLRVVLSLTSGPKCVSEIHSCVGKGQMTLSAISHQLSLLHNQSIVTYKKEGKEKIFSLSDNFCWCILKDSFEHFSKKGCCKK